MELRPPLSAERHPLNDLLKPLRRSHSGVSVDVETSSTVGLAEFQLERAGE